MKMKYTAAIALAIWLAVTGWLATMVIAKPAILHLGNEADETPAMAELRAAVERNRRAREQTPVLRRTVFTDDGRPLVALPTLAGSGSAYAGGGAGIGLNADGADAPLDVSMVLDTDGRRMAIIDGTRVRVGSRLADGSRVRAIASGRVRIVRPDGEVVDRHVESPFLPSQAGGGSQ